MFSAAIGTLLTMTFMDAPLSSAGERPTEVGLSPAVDLGATSGPVLPPSPAGAPPTVVPELASALPPSPTGDSGSTAPSADGSPPSVSALPSSSAAEGVVSTTIPPVDVGVAAATTTTPPATSAKRLTWPTVERAVQGLARRLRKCSEDDAITLGLQVKRGRVTLESFDGKPAAALPHHKCARKALASRELADTRKLSGVVAVVLE